MKILIVQFCVVVNFLTIVWGKVNPSFVKSPSIPWINFKCGDGISVESRWPLLGNQSKYVINNVECSLEPNILSVLNTAAEQYILPSSKAGLNSFSVTDTCKNVLFCKPNKLQNNMCDITYQMDFSSKNGMFLFNESTIAPNGLVYSFDPQCKYNLRSKPNTFISRSHRFLNVPEGLKVFKTLSIPKEGFNVTSDGEDLYIKTPIIESIHNDPRYPVLINEPSFFLNHYFDSRGVQQKRLKTNNLKPCNTWCDYGKLMLFNVSENTIFDFELNLKKSCDWVMFCSKITLEKPSVCELVDTTIIALRNDFIQFPMSRLAIPMKLHTGRNLHDFTKIGLTKTLDGKMIVTNALRERAVNVESQSRNGMTMGFLFSHSNCLKENMGVITSAGNGYVALQNGEDSSNVKKGPLKNAPRSIKQTAEIIISTTTEDPLKKIAMATTTLRSFVDQNTIMLNTLDEALNKYSGYRTWAIFDGFLAGTIFGTLFLTVFFYTCRRSIFSIWYRGMYSRYKCDASERTYAEFGTTTIDGMTTEASMMTTVAEQTENLTTYTKSIAM